MVDLGECVNKRQPKKFTHVVNVAGIPVRRRKDMVSLYHSVPENVQGHILSPLSALKEKYPDIYEQQMRKYVGREQITQQRIPILDCLWNDVLHFVAVNPKAVKEALIEAGRNPEVAMSYYQVDPKLIEPKNAIVYLYPYADNKDPMNEENFVPYHPDEIAKFSGMPEATKEYYKGTIEKGERPLLYHRIPHILYRGTIDITDLPIISV
ncbi:hypothetical protein FJZ23_02815 [Candidatus Parcubacteria bacterium]|nr:hypothetical protein [Candidatus Parcubacteria bacterium]